jgi:hypothetical protein
MSLATPESENTVSSPMLAYRSNVHEPHDGSGSDSQGTQEVHSKGEWLPELLRVLGWRYRFI